MAFPVAQTIKRIGFTKLHRASGIPLRTLFRWAEEDALPGRSDSARDARRRQLEEAIAKVEGQPRPTPKKQRKAAA
jgi:hypothetical protein